jgi:ATP-binding cassette subfamily F protein 3
MPSQPKIEATSQQTRFNPANDGATSTTTFSRYSTSSNLNTGKHDLDLHDVNLTIEGKTILSGTRIKLSNGVKYLLHGQNGIGKSTLLKALGEKLIPGIPGAIRISILLQQQRDVDDDNEAEDGDDATENGGRQDKIEQEEPQCISALDLVVQSDRLQTEAIRKRDRK